MYTSAILPVVDSTPSIVRVKLCPLVTQVPGCSSQLTLTGTEK